MNNISFLLGAGFSKPAGLPLAEDISDYFLKLREKDIYFDNYEVTENKNNISELSQERFDFVCDLIKHYYYYINYNFNYEIFYGWYLNIKKESKSLINLQQKYNVSYNDLFSDFDYLFNNVIKYILYKELHKPNIDNNLIYYHGFIEFINKSLDNKVYIHTLNHDTLIEKLFSVNNINFDEGFQLLSGYLDEFEATKEHLTFVNTFNQNLQLIKLHGSTDYYQFIHSPYSLFKTYERVYDENTRTEIKPKFITGIDKERLYQEDKFYAQTTHRFIDNLKDSKELYIIGYSFKDTGINNLLMSCIFDNKIKVNIVGKGLDMTNSIIQEIVKNTKTEIWNDGLESYKFNERI